MDKRKTDRQRPTDVERREQWEHIKQVAKSTIESDAAGRKRKNERLRLARLGIDDGNPSA